MKKMLMLCVLLCSGCVQDSNLMFKKTVQAYYKPISTSYNRMLKENLDAGKLDQDSYDIQKQSDTALNSFLNK